MERPRRAAASRALDAQRAAIHDHDDGPDDGARAPAPALAPAPTPWPAPAPPPARAARGRARVRGRGRAGRASVSGRADGDESDAYEPGAASSSESYPDIDVDTQAHADDDANACADADADADGDFPGVVPRPSKQARTQTSRGGRASGRRQHGALRLNRRGRARGWDRKGFHQLPGGVEAGMSGYYRRGSHNVSTFENWSAPLNMGTPYLRPTVFPRLDADRPSEPESEPGSNEGPLPAATAPVVNSESQEMGGLLTREAIASGCEAVPWPRDGLANLVPVGSHDYSSPTDRVGKWILELSHPPRALLADYAWVPGKVPRAHARSADANEAPLPPPPGPTPRALDVGFSILSPTYVDRSRSASARCTELTHRPNTREAQRFRSRALTIAQERQAHATDEGDQDVIMLNAGSMPKVQVVYGAMPESIPAGDERGRINPQTVELHAGQSAELQEGLGAGLNPSVLYTGGYTYDVASCPRGLNMAGMEYFAMSVAHDASPTTLLGARDESRVPGTIQIWSVAPLSSSGARVRLDLVLHTFFGTASALSWRPLPHGVSASDVYGSDVLGHLACVFPDGTLRVFQVPDPYAAARRRNSLPTQPVPMQIETPAVLTLDLLETQILSLDWAGHSRLATGCANGHVAVWDVACALAGKSSAVRPTAYFRAQESMVTQVRWAMHPPIELGIKTDTDGGETASERAKWTSPPDELYTASLNGTLTVSKVSGETTELRLGMVGASTLAYAMAWCPVTALPLVEGTAHSLVSVFTRPPNYARTRKVGMHHGPASAIASSAFHAFAASGSFDGAVRIHNIMRSALTRTTHHRASVPLYRLALDRDPDASTNTGTKSSAATTDTEPDPDTVTPTRFRLIEFLAPELLINKSLPLYDPPPPLQVTGLAWSQAINRGYLLVSTHASGLARVQWIGSAQE